MQYRTHTCGELRAEDAGKEVVISGWYENLRKVSKNLGFLVLRDFYGVTQVVIETEEMMAVVDAENTETVLMVKGTVRERSSKNTEIPTGDIEVVPREITVLGRCQYAALPFEVNRSKEADENTRLRYRYLDLRNPDVKGRMIMRSKIVSELRRRMEELGFFEITTPILTCSSPEGARDYLVPSRNWPGKFYALPQAPQQFKQLLMASGFDRYFQIAPCFRDEDARGDRTPGEFYQLDMEMAFAGQDDVLAVLERVLVPVFREYGVYKRVTPAPFRRIPFAEAMEKYGTDKPDLRIDLEIQDATELLGNVGFGPFEGNTVKAVVVSGFNATRKQIDKLIADVEVQTAEKTYWFRLDEGGEIVGGVSKFVKPVQEQVIAALGLQPGCFVGLAAGKKAVAQKVAGVLRTKLGALCPEHMDREQYQFCWIVDFPMYEIGEESGELEFCHNPFSMPEGGLDALEKAARGEIDPLSPGGRVLLIGVLPRLVSRDEEAAEAALCRTVDVHGDGCVRALHGDGGLHSAQDEAAVVEDHTGALPVVARFYGQKWLRVQKGEEVIHSVRDGLTLVQAQAVFVRNGLQMPCHALPADAVIPIGRALVEQDVHVLLRAVEHIVEPFLERQILPVRGVGGAYVVLDEVAGLV